MSESKIDIAAARRGDEVRPYDEAVVIDYIEKSGRGEQKGPEGALLDAAPTPEEMAGKVYMFSARLCPFAHRAWWSLTEKNANDKVEYVHINLGPTKPAWYKEKINPSGTVPCIVDDNKPVFESDVVVEYLEDKFAGSGTPLLPADAADRAKVRNFIKEFNSNYIKPCYQLLMNKDATKDEELKTALREKVAALNQLFAAGSASGPFFLGSEISAADINLVPFLFRFQHTLAFYRGFDFLPEGDDAVARLRDVLAASQDRPAFQHTTLPPEYILAVYYNYAKPADA